MLRDPAGGVQKTDKKRQKGVGMRAEGGGVGRGADRGGE